MLKRLVLCASVLCLSVFLAACDTAEERAQKHYEKGLELLESGDVERALVEFRNVFKLNGFHKEARITYAQVQEDRGNIQEAYSQYLRLVEQYPENLIGRRALARMASDLNNWEEVQRHVEVAENLAPEDPVVMAVRAGLDYRNALRDNNPEVAELAVKVSEKLLETNPDMPAARRVVIDDLVRREDWTGALKSIDDAIKVDGNQNLYLLRLSVLEQLGRNDEIIEQLKEMVQLFPDAGLHQTLVSRYMAADRTDEAEAYLRSRAEQADLTELGPEAQLGLVGFLVQVRGRDAGIAEIDRILAQDTAHQALFRSMRAGLEFDAGKRDAAIAEMEDILKDAEPSEETDRIKVALANMLVKTGNSVGARAQIEEVLKHDPGQIEALKLKAGWLIEDDQAGDALIDLRAALDKAPRDAQVMTLMAQAHERTGNRDLMGEMLALAVEASGNAAEESLRYALFLVKDEKYLPAEDILLDALRRQNTNVALLSALGELYLRMEDWARTQQVIDRLRRLETDQTLAIANELTVRVLAARNQARELEQFLSSLAESDSGLRAVASVVRLRLAQNDVPGALAYVNDRLAKDPDNPTLQFLKAGVLIADGQEEQALDLLTDLSAASPQDESVWLALYRLHRSLGDEEKATQVLTDALSALPDSPNLKWTLASEAEARGDIDGAISIYEELYATNSNSAVIANNLASLISSYHDDDDSLQRAYNIARRLRGTDVPAFQETYGWIAHRLGNYDEALAYLEPAAAALITEPVAQYHLAETYAALGRAAEALEQFEKTRELAGDIHPRPAYMDRVDAEIERLSQPKE